MAADFLLQGETISRLLAGLSVTLRISLVSVALSLPMGVLMGVLFTRRNPLLRAVLRGADGIRDLPDAVNIGLEPISELLRSVGEFAGSVHQFDAGLVQIVHAFGQVGQFIQILIVEV